MDLIALLHHIFGFFLPFYILVGGPSKYYELLLAFLLLTIIHWSFFRNECIVSYLCKKRNNCDYSLGDETNSTDLKVNGSYILVYIQLVCIFISGLYMSIKIGYDVKIFLLITIAAIVPRYIEGEVISQFLAAILSIYFLKDNKYLLPGLIILLGSTAIVHHKDRNGCIRK